MHYYNSMKNMPHGVRGDGVCKQMCTLSPSPHHQHPGLHAKKRNKLNALCLANRGNCLFPILKAILKTLWIFSVPLLYACPLVSLHCPLLYTTPPAAQQPAWCHVQEKLLYFLFFSCGIYHCMLQKNWNQH